MALDARAAAAQVVAEVLAGHSLNQALPGRLLKVSVRDHGLLQQLCYGTLRHEPRLQAILAQLVAKPLRARDGDLQALLLCGLYQLDNLRVPDHAAVDATVRATKILKKDWARGMTNAILRRYLREREQLVLTLDAAAAASHPAWIYDKVIQQWPTAAASILDTNNQQPPMTLRVNCQQRIRDDYLADLHSAGIEASAATLSPQAVQLLQPVDVEALPGFAAGHASVQDEAAQMAALLLGATAGDRVLDACAAPGGKTCHILELQPQLAELVAMDINATRLQKVSDNLSRLGLAATIVTGDAATPPLQLQAKRFDRILVDAPCSASGVIRRHPDVKLLRRDSDLARLAAQQMQILMGLWPLLQPGASLLYATCSIFDEENSQVVQRFLDAQDDAVLDALECDWGQATACGRQLLPTAEGPDGLFFARLRKVR